MTGQTYELDLYASYDFWSISLTVTNYTFPGATGAYGDDYGLFDGDMEVTASAFNWSNWVNCRLFY